jgi:glycosyltransferase involved in cell wall biosynthesis
LFIPDARVGWIRSVTAKAIQLHLEHLYDGFITTGPPHSTHVAGLRIKKKTGLYWLADMRDPWVNIHYNQLIPRSRLAVWLDTRLERNVLTTADDVVVVTPGMKRDFEKAYPNRYHIIPNGFDEEDLPVNQPAGKQKNSPFLMRHVGSLPESSVPFGFFDALKSLPATLDWRLEFIGNVHPDTHGIITEFALEKKVLFLPYRPHAEALQMMQEATVLCLFLPKTKGSGSIYSGKLFEYAGLRKPVFYVGESTGDGAEFLRNAGLGLIYEHSDTDGMRKALETLITGSAALPQPDEPQNAFIDGFSRRALTDKLIQILSDRLGN